MKITLVNIPKPVVALFRQVLCIHRFSQEESWLNEEPFELEAIFPDLRNNDMRIFSTLNTDVIITRGYTYLLLVGSRVDIPVVNPPFFLYDVVLAMQEAQKRFGKKKIAFIASERSLYGAQTVAEMLGMNVAFFYPPAKNHLSEARRYISQAIAEGCEAIAAGENILKLVAHPQIGKILIGINRDSIYEALTEAKKLAILYRYERERSENMKTILDSVHDGIVAFDKKQRFLVCNDVASRSFQLKREALLGRGLDEAGGCGPLNQLMDQPETFSNRLIDFQGKTFTVNKAFTTLCNAEAGTVVTFQDITEVQRLERKIRHIVHASGHVARTTFDQIIGDSPALRHAVEQAKAFALSDSNVLIVGETGTGKELFAQSIHNYSKRSSQPFVAVNCAALSESLLESELFGYVDGAFTGAAKGGRAGLFELAHGGTIFLDEVSEIPLNLQAKLLRVIQEREVRRVGAHRVIPIDIRILCATNLDLLEETRQNRFRNDLYYRLDVLCLEVPPLRQRGRDSLLLLQHYIEKFCKANGRPSLRLMPEATEMLSGYPWPGNVRELINLSERICVLESSQTLSEEKALEILGGSRRSSEIQPQVRETPVAGQAPMCYIQSEKERLEQALRLARNHQGQAAALLGISRTTLWRKLKLYGLTAADSQDR